MNSSDKNNVILITGTRKGIGRYLAEYYVSKGYTVCGCSREKNDYTHEKYHHYCLDITDETSVKKMMSDIGRRFQQLSALINNAGIASMNHTLLTPIETAQKIFNTNFFGTFLLCREAAKLMQMHRQGRIINFSTVAVPLKLEGEAVYASSKAAVVAFTQVLAKELATYGITVNAVGPTPIKTDLIRNVPKDKIDNLIRSQAIRRFGEYEDVSNVIDFFLNPKSHFVTGQVIYLGGV